MMPAKDLMLTRPVAPTLAVLLMASYSSKSGKGCPFSMGHARKAGKPALIGVILASLAGISTSGAQVPEDVRTDFVQWARQSLHRVSDANLDAPTSDLRPMREIVGAAKIVGLSEGQHVAAEPLAFRNRLFKYLVKNLGFDAIAIESGIATFHPTARIATRSRRRSQT